MNIIKVDRVQHEWSIITDPGKTICEQYFPNLDLGLSINIWKLFDLKPAQFLKCNIYYGKNSNNMLSSNGLGHVVGKLLVDF